MALSYLQEASIRDRKGNCRCPYCGKYRKRSEFQDQAYNIPFGKKGMGGHISVPPACVYCLELSDDQPTKHEPECQKKQ